MALSPLNDDTSISISYQQPEPIIILNIQNERKTVTIKQ